jgi:hypothetical protein
MILNQRFLKKLSVRRARADADVVAPVADPFEFLYSIQANQRFGVQHTIIGTHQEVSASGIDGRLRPFLETAPEFFE